MHFPPYWAKASAQARARDGQMVTREVWGWSDASEPEARRRAGERALRLAAQTATAPGAQPEYGYPGRPLREPVLRVLADGTAGLNAVVTRNSYGCEVLNTDRLVFVDVDLPPAKPSALFARLFGKKESSDDERTHVEAEKIARLEAWQRRHPAHAFRIYRTAAGLRYVLLSSLHSPRDPLIEDAFAALDADPDYRRLCRQQESFRARVSPKPWRIGQPRPPHRFPFANAGQIARNEEWLAHYNAAAQGHAVCLHLLTLGDAPLAPGIAPIVAEHDRLAGVASSRSLA